MKPFTTSNPDTSAGGQVSAWLEKWNRLDPDIREGKKAAITVEQLQKSRLLGICETPIVLLMAAATWQGMERQETVSRAHVYERFMLQVARGKYEHDQEHHPVVAKAADTMKVHLVDKDEMKEGDSSPEAMLWLMARVAWEGQRLAKKGKELTVRHVENLLADELNITDLANAELIKMGLLLVLQAELATGNHRITYQHKSFREFLVARYWAMTLWDLAESGSDRKELEKRLLGARLFIREDESFDFLQQMLNAPPWDDTRRTALHRWADIRFHDEHPEYGAKERRSWSTDQAPALREAALAIAGSLKIENQEPRGIQVRNPEALRTLVAWWWVQQSAPGLRAPRVHTDGIGLESAYLESSYLLRAHLKGANLTEANLRGANLIGANLTEANLKGAKLEWARLGRAHLERTDLRWANLRWTDLEEVHLEGANLTGANFQQAHLQGAHLQGADLEGALLEGAHLEGVNLTRAFLARANLKEADLTGADLGGANLRGANLQEADLTGANLKETDLRGANLKEVKREGANFFGALCDRGTLWSGDKPDHVKEVAYKDDSERIDD